MFLVGVIFFLYRVEDIVKYVSLFTLGHSTTLLLGVLGGVRANPYLIDAVIALSVVYKAFDNMGGFKRFLGFQPNTKLAVLTFGLFHGFGLASKLQELTLSKSGLILNILSFNVGVEIGQVLALIGRAHRAELLAHAGRLPAARLRRQHGADDRRIHSPGLPVDRLSHAMSGSGANMSENSAVLIEAPSKQQILKATAVAILVALVIFFVAVIAGRVWDRSAAHGRGAGLDESGEVRGRLVLRRLLSRQR